VVQQHETQDAAADNKAQQVEIHDQPKKDNNGDRKRPWGFYLSQISLDPPIQSTGECLADFVTNSTIHVKGGGSVHALSEAEESEPGVMELINALYDLHIEGSWAIHLRVRPLTGADTPVVELLVLLNVALQPGMRCASSNAVSLVLSNVRCDWGTLRGALPKSKASFTMEGVYRAIKPAVHVRGRTESSMFANESGPKANSCESATPQAQLQMVAEVCLEHVGLFLKASSLSALCHSCKRLHGMMHGGNSKFVAGLKLSLFPHQSRSLSWMLGRERQSCSSPWATAAEQRRRAKDSAFMEGGLESLGNENTQHVRLVARPLTLEQGGTAALTAIGARTGGAAAGDEGELFVDLVSLQVRSHAQMAEHWQAVRGGLLCDEPGLGKTVTVLALVMKTAWMQTVRQPWTAADTERVQKRDADNSWAALESTDKRRELLQLLKRLRQSGRDGNGVHYYDYFHSFPEASSSSSAALADLNGVSRLIEKGGYLTVQAFHEDVKRCVKTRVIAAKTAVHQARKRASERLARAKALRDQARERAGAGAGVAAGGTTFVDGEPVEAQWKTESETDREWYSATVVRCNDDGTFHLKYADGDEWEQVPRSKLREIDGVGGSGGAAACFFCHEPDPEYMSTNRDPHNVPSVPVCGLKCEAAYLQSKGQRVVAADTATAANHWQLFPVEGSAMRHRFKKLPSPQQPLQQSPAKTAPKELREALRLAADVESAASGIERSLTRALTDLKLKLSASLGAVGGGQRGSSGAWGGSAGAATGRRSSRGSTSTGAGSSASAGSGWGDRALQRAKLEARIGRSKLLSATATLIVVPGPLLTHWQEQLVKVCDLAYLLPDSNVDTGMGNAAAAAPAPAVAPRKKARTKASAARATSPSAASAVSPRGKRRKVEVNYAVLAGEDSEGGGEWQQQRRRLKRRVCDDDAEDFRLGNNTADLTGEDGDENDDDDGYEERGGRKKGGAEGERKGKARVGSAKHSVEVMDESMGVDPNMAKVTMAKERAEAAWWVAAQRAGVAMVDAGKQHRGSRNDGIEVVPTARRRNTVRGGKGARGSGPRVATYSYPPQRELARRMAKQLVVLTTTERMSQEAKRVADSEGHYQSAYQQVLWLRLVLDEGHTMGNTGISNIGSFLASLVAERVWACTGTPTKNVDATVGLRNVLGLMRFLKQQPFGLPRAGGTDLWKELVSKPFLEQQLEGSRRLTQLLRAVMVRTTKEDIPPSELPRPVRRTKLIEMVGEEMTNYNTRCSFIMTNLVLTIKPDGKLQEESLLYHSNSSAAMKQVEFLRLMCCGGGKQAPSISDKNRVLVKYMMLCPPCAHPQCQERKVWGRFGFHGKHLLQRGHWKGHSMSNSPRKANIHSGHGGGQATAKKASHEKMQHEKMQHEKMLPTVMEEDEDEDEDEEEDEGKGVGGAMPHVQGECQCTCCAHNMKCGYSGFGRSEEEWKRVDRFIGRAIVGEGTRCAECDIVLPLQLVTPCAHFFCPQCITKSLGKCLTCGQKHTFDELQLLQPGFGLDWAERLDENTQEGRHNASNRLLARIRETQQRMATEDRARTGTRPMTQAQREQRQRDDRFLELAQAELGAFGGAASTAGVVALAAGGGAAAAAAAAAAIGSGSGSGSSSSGFSSAVGSAHTSTGWGVGYMGGIKSQYIVSTVRELITKRRQSGDGGSSGGGSSGGSSSSWRPTTVASCTSADPPPVKVIVFSQFRQALNLVGHDLITQFGQDAVAEFYGSYRNMELQKFKTDLTQQWTCKLCGFSNSPSDSTCQRRLNRLMLDPPLPAAPPFPGAPGDEVHEAAARAWRRVPNFKKHFMPWIMDEEIHGYFLGRRYVM
jgi:hypothetical protein